MAFESIQIFACDHRKNVRWDLPYIRFGGPESECAIKINANKIFDIEVNADETPKLFWLWKNLEDLGNPDIIGYCQYRRFFGAIQTKYPIVDIAQDQFKRDYALLPIQQLALINNYQCDGILHPAINVIDKTQHHFEYIWEQIYILTKEAMLPIQFQKTAFDIFLDESPDWLKEFVEKSFKISENYLCNIFTVKADIFKMFGKIAFSSALKLIQMLSINQKKQLFPCWLAYIFERYTSCFYHALELSGKYKFLKVPLMTIDGHKHTSWESNQ